ncbi:tRNA lysidine(34) synthetase TilS [Companilactobacillus pabuli]|jgi:tRNA(Ile)-lysidine synthase|uniref:tRNA(Ile)-lysidine synthase n=1 Tax=Companilactobacillus pabuli TaxID=2714036 RepID=A0A7L7KXX7_9LACO|nr:tRNA lysidine(34) synthetase TilS [Companilactobacillus pabuli]MDG5113900.1 tRNA lysidine(34) synthetase TilS [Companilactobacillus pabuli]QMT84657.1 tRNA lysidine(34) synthetase TilS [Companilactobacillus pabuli]
MELDNKLLGTLRQKLQRYQAKKVLVAVSGGVDSMVLLHVVGRVLDPDNFAVVDVDHDLRPESADEVKFVKKYCVENGYQFFTTKWRKKPKDVGMEAAARSFRYDFFKKVMAKGNFDTLLTAHHNNDLAENILMKMIRSGNAYEVVSLKEQRPFGTGQIVRPLLDFSKRQLAEYADIHDINHVQDETNFDNITMRNRLRNNIFPELQKENGQLLSHFRFFDQQLTALINLAKKQFISIEKAMDLRENSQQIIGRIKPVLQLDKGQQTLFWGNFFTKRKLDISISNRQIDQIIEVLTGDQSNAAVDLEDSWRFIRTYNQFVIKKATPTNFETIDVKLNQTITFNGKKIKITNDDSGTLVVDKIPQTITLRTRRDGDKLLLSNGKHQKLSKRFINEKIPEYERKNYLVLLFDNQIVWVEKIYNMSDYLKKGNKHYKINFVEVKE